MIALDTNVLVRYIVQDDPNQAARASRFIDKSISTDNKAFIAVIVLCELVWVLESRYRFSRSQVAAVIEKLLAAGEFMVEARKSVIIAHHHYQVSGADFVDCLLGLLAQDVGCKTVVTFDKKASRLMTHTFLN